jgi:hypothetical protein
MARRKNPLFTLFLLAVAVLCGLVGYTYYETGRPGLWPKYTETERQVGAWEDQLRDNEKRIAKLQNQLSMGMRGVPRDEIEQEIAELEEENLRLRRLIKKYR